MAEKGYRDREGYLDRGSLWLTPLYAGMNDKWLANRNSGGDSQSEEAEAYYSVASLRRMHRHFRSETFHFIVFSTD